MAQGKREHLLNTALTLFDREGFAASGIDRILAEAGVAKMTLYNNFGSKDALIEAAMKARDDAFRQWFVGAVEARATDPRAQLGALFEVLGDWFRDPSFRGCLFQKAAAEFPDPASPARRAALAHKAALLNYIREMAAAAGASDPVGLAGEIFLLMEGAIAAAHQTGDTSAARRAGAAAEKLIEAALA